MYQPARDEIKQQATNNNKSMDIARGIHREDRNKRRSDETI